MPRTVWAAAPGRSRRPLCAPGTITSGQSKSSAATLVPASRGVPIESSPRSTAATVFDARTLSQSGTQVIVIPYSFAMKLRPLRRACLASASVNLGASGSESPMAPRKARNALETFPAAIISSKTGAAPRPVDHTINLFSDLWIRPV